MKNSALVLISLVFTIALAGCGQSEPTSKYITHPPPPGTPPPNAASISAVKQSNLAIEHKVLQRRAMLLKEQKQ
jgi:hypothetical protein